eukprot:scaffold187023_cov31-Tisochrysis_lutea.AAC.5
MASAQVGAIALLRRYHCLPRRVELLGEGLRLSALLASQALSFGLSSESRVPLALSRCCALQGLLPSDLCAQCCLLECLHISTRGL